MNPDIEQAKVLIGRLTADIMDALDSGNWPAVYAASSFLQENAGALKIAAQTYMLHDFIEDKGYGAD